MYHLQNTLLKDKVSYLHFYVSRHFLLFTPGWGWMMCVLRATRTIWSISEPFLDCLSKDQLRHRVRPYLLRQAI